MSNEIVSFDSDQFKKDLMQGLSNAELDSDSPLNNIQTGLPRFTVDKNVFVKKLGGEILQRYKGIEELDMVIHHINGPLPQRQYYPDAYDPSKAWTPPPCYSNSGTKPDERSSDIQSENCSTCSQNIKGSNGRGGRACSYTRQILVSEIVAGGSPQLMLMNVNAGSLFGDGEEPDSKVFNFENLLRFLKESKVDTYKAAVQFQIDTKKPDNNCKLLFKALGYLKEDQPNREAHEKFKEEHDFADLCSMSYTAREDQSSPQPASKAPESKAPKKPSADKVKAADKSAADSLGDLAEGDDSLDWLKD